MEDQLIQLAQTYNMSVSYDQAKLLVCYLELLTEKNKQINLSGIKTCEEGLYLHILDSLLLLSTFQKCKGNFIDLGTGGGCPGIPLSIMTQREGILLDATGKKVTACNEFIQTLKITSLQAHKARAEEFAQKHPKSFGIVVSRAMAPLKTLIEYAKPFLVQNGYLIATKGKNALEELSEAQNSLRLCGMKYVSRETYDLPNNYGHREILLFQNVEKAKIKLPRKNGEAKNNPL